MKGFAWLKVDWPILHLQQHVRRKLAVERLKIFVSGAGPVVTRLRVVNKRAPNHDAMMRRNGGSQHVCAVGVRAIVSSWSRLSFAVCLDEETSEIGNHFVDVVRLCFPPGDHRRIEWVSRRQLSQVHRRRKTCRQK